VEDTGAPKTINLNLGLQEPRVEVDRLKMINLTRASGAQGGPCQAPKLQSGTSRTQCGPRRAPPGFEDVVDVSSESEMEESPASPSPNVSEMDTDDDAVLDDGSSGDPDDGF